MYRSQPTIFVRFWWLYDEDSLRCYQGVRGLGFGVRVLGCVPQRASEGFVQNTTSVKGFRVYRDVSGISGKS